MMQEHPHLDQASQRVERGKNGWTVPAHTFLNFFGKIVRRRLNESIHEKRTCIIL
jgi:hypothetical protein